MITLGRAGLAMVAWTAVACARPAAPDDGRIAAWRDDLHTLATEISTHHKNPFFRISGPDWHAAIADLDAHIPTLDDAHVIAGIYRLVALLGDAHTMIGAPANAQWYALAFVWFDDGIFVVGAAPDQAWAVGRKLVGVGGHSTDDVIATLTPYIAHENLAGLHAHVPEMLQFPDLLVGADLATADHATFALAAADGSVRQLDLKPGKSGVPVAPPPVKPLPLHLTGPASNYWNQYVAADHLLYFAYNACADDAHEQPFAAFAAGTFAFIDQPQHPIDRVVIDLRNNGGGNSLIIGPLLDGLAARPALAGRVFAIIGMHTFSSGGFAAMDLKRRVHATLVGGETSGKPSAYGDVLTYVLPHSQMHGQYSTKLFANPDFPGDAIEPDIAVKVTADDWFSGRDPAMAAIAATPVPR